MALPKGTRTPVFAVRRASATSPHSLQHVLDRAFGLRELMCIVGAQHHIRVGPVLRWLPASLMNQSYGLLRAAFDGIFAIGDVRSGSIKRVAAAVGEGAQVVATLHATLASMESKIPGEPAAQRG